MPINSFKISEISRKINYVNKMKIQITNEIFFKYNKTKQNNKTHNC